MVFKASYLSALIGLQSTLMSHLAITNTPFGCLPNGTTIEKYILTNTNGVKAHIITLGGRLTELYIPDQKGKHANITMGFDSLEGYLQNDPYFGAIVGRYGNRIANASFKLDGQIYKLAANNGPNNLHGGEEGFESKVWDATTRKDQDAVYLELTYLSADGEEGFPGNLQVKVTYTLTETNELKVVYHAITDKATVVNLTHHGYFNLSGDLNTEVLDHHLQLNAESYLPVDVHSIPTGELRSVVDTPFDFTRMKPIGEAIDATNDQLEIGNGYDHCWVVDGLKGDLRQAATVQELSSGRTMEVWTTEPGVQLYTANWLDGSLENPAGGTFNRRCAFCLETQHFPDSPNKPDFPSVRLHPGEVYNTTTVFKFGIV
ncbi:galactose mutarotase [Flavobacterium sp. ASW18X]|nr:galactose mutarotase [Flavobacterium sp. ASW18X]